MQNPDIARGACCISMFGRHFQTARTTQVRLIALPLLGAVDEVSAKNKIVLVGVRADVPSQIITVWDRRSTRTDLVTGRDVPDETKRLPLLAYVNPRPADWPAADFIVGNPPFIGKVKLREDLGDGYVETLRAAYPEMPESADFVLYWWHKAAALVRAGQAKRFGLITTNSLRQTFARRVVQMHLTPGSRRGDEADGRGAATNPPPHVGGYIPLSLVFAIADHPWVDTAEGAAVRIAMTVGVAGEHQGDLLEVTSEQPQDDGSERVTFTTQRGKISADLTVGADVTTTVALKANFALANPGVQLSGQGFIVQREDLRTLATKTQSDLIRRYITGRDLMQESREQFVFDTFGLSQENLRSSYPDAFQLLYDRVRPERLTNARESYRHDWWIHAEPRGRFRQALAGLHRFIVTSRTARHRVFQFVDSAFLPESKVLILAFDDAFMLGVLSSAAHVTFANAAGGWLGVGNDSTYNHSDCLEKFPFPLCREEEKERIRKLAEELDAHRKRVQAQHGLTLTGLYNVLEKLRTASLGSRRREEADPTAPGNPPPHVGGYELTPKEKLTHDLGLVSVLKQLHDELDAAVCTAYGWVRHGQPETALPDAEILERLVALNAERAAEEKRGVIHWLRPEYQVKKEESGIRSQKSEAGRVINQSALNLPPTKAKPAVRKSKIVNRKLEWPKAQSERVQSIEALLQSGGEPQTAKELASHSKRADAKAIAKILDALTTLGRAHRHAGARYSR